MTQELAKLPAEQAKAALASAVDQGSGLDLMTLSTIMVQSGFFPNAESVAQGVVKILAGRELGFPAIASMRHIYVHNGHIGLQATLIATKIRQSGTYDYRILESTDKRCEIEFIRKGPDGKWGAEGKAAFTIEEAQRAGLIKEKSAWTTYPSDLLFARAMTRGQRRYCPDVFGQSVYSEEEIHEIAAADPKLVGGQTLEERMAEMMPKEKATPVSPAEDTPSGPAEQAPATGDAPPSQANTPAPPAVAGESGSEAAAGVLQGNGGGNPPQPWALPHTQDNYQPMSDAEVKGVQPDLPAGQTEPAATEQAHPSAVRPLFEPTRDTLGLPVPMGLPQKTTFTVGKQTFETNGITRAQLMELFKICPRVGKKCGAEKPAEVLLKEFSLKHRVDLTEEQAERYTIRLREMLEN